MAKRQCAFCIKPATTGEHAWSNWANSLLGKSRRYVISREMQGARRAWSVGLHEKLPALCNTCNNEWGNDIETPMKNVSSSMVKSGHRTLLNAKDIAAIAVYSQLKAFVCDYAQEEVKSFYDTGDRRAFRNNLTFPSGTNIWLAWTVDDHGVFSSAYAKPPLNTPKRFHTYIFTMSIGQLVIQLTSVRWTKKSNRKFALPGFLTQGPFWDVFSIPIWPANFPIPINWPPPQQMGRDALNTFFDRWQVLNRAD